ncbi:MAG: adenosylcobalamin-dependent ribonucleoside-diphosphate reductase [Lentisphaerae bacterium]|nr:adenosylcobalamin-dependent ribonucleoside-diphosphate reductase [Lentisphaerota bacterium]MCP4101634.1 adenosylcobalamin-dependent ribonucleoside-diphosphate reductase [Lentisphaerota bacterium]
MSHDIWNRKYRYQGNKNLPEDSSIQATMQRVASACAGAEKDPKAWQKKFEDVLCSFEFIPGGRIIANAGTSREEVTMFNCYVMNKIDDSIEGIFDTVKESAMTQKQGGGVGFDFSTIRPEGFHIRGCEAQSSGPISFMQVLDSTCRTIMSAGQRRGAQMGIMRCDHPDIEKFINAKRKNSQLQMFNLSVAITSDFMEAVKNDTDWDLQFNGKIVRTVKARELWDQIMNSTYNYAEPGFILVDKINQMNNLHYCEEIRATNPCGEQPLPPYGACLLGSVNLTRFVKDPFTDKAEFDFARLKEVVPLAVRMLDNVIEMSHYPLDKQQQEAFSKRRMGIGITGLGDALIFLGKKYGSPESVKVVGKIMQTITHNAYRASVQLSKEKGSFEMFDKKHYLSGDFVKALPKDIRDDIAEHGIRNSHLTSIAPTGTISLLAGNVSSGLEPVFAFKYTRRIRNTTEDDFSEVEISDYAYRKYCEHLKVDSVEEKALPDYFVSSNNIKPVEHLEIQAELQKYIDSSISKTINIPADYPFEDFKDIYMKAYEKGLKGCTTFRPSEYIAGVLIRDDDKKKKEKEKEKAEAEKHEKHLKEHKAKAKLVKRPEELEGTTYKIKTSLSPDAFYVTINDHIEKEKRRPYELFINTKNLQHFSWIVAISRLISAVFRHDPEPTFLVDELKSVYDPNGGYFKNGKYMPSLAAEIGYVVEQHLGKLGITEKKTAKKKLSLDVPKTELDSNKMICPNCNERELINQENCLKCLACEYSKCG